MKQFREPQIIAAIILALSLAVATRAQENQPPEEDSRPVPKVEVGAQYSKIRFADSDPSPIIAGFVTYNITRHLSVDAGAYFFPIKIFGDGYVTGGRPFQMQAGVRIGKRFHRFGLFAKARPGFITFGGTFTPKLGQSFIGVDGRQFFTVDFDAERKTHFTLDLGGVVEYYASRRVFARFDVGDTLIRFGSHDELDFNLSPNPIFRVQTRTHIYPQFSAGVGVQLGSRGDDNRAASAKSGGRRSAPTRFEAGALFTSLSFSPVRQLTALPLIPGPPMTTTGLGFGGRFTYNFNRVVAVEAETDRLPRSLFLTAGASGSVTQGQFGVKVGRRFRSFGLFAKARPGFVSFDSSLKLVGTRPFTFDGRQFFAGVFETGRRTFFSADVGGVFELYASRRWLLRFDVGDTIIHYGERSIDSFMVNPAILTVPPETHHNFQFSSGVSFRF